MLNRIRKDEKGFTLIELLVVILIIGILAAIALPAFLGQRVKGQDSSAKSNARNAVSHMESCFTENETYVGCGSLTNAGLPVGTAAGEVSVAENGSTGYTVTAVSESTNVFTITKAGATVSRTCTVNNDDNGGCPTDTTW